MPYRDSTTTLLIRDALEGNCLTMVLACINPGMAQYSETRNVLDFVVRASTIPLSKEGVAAGDLRNWEDMINGRGYECHILPHPHECLAHLLRDAFLNLTGTHDFISMHASSASFAAGPSRLTWHLRYDPMEDDEFDSDETLNRRTEFIETASFEPLHCRCVGEPDMPLLLYIHSPREIENPTDPTSNLKKLQSLENGGSSKRMTSPAAVRRTTVGRGNGLNGGKESKEPRPRPARDFCSLAWNATILSVSKALLDLERVDEPIKRVRRPMGCRGWRVV